jgi:hypothetical protein
MAAEDPTLSEHEQGIVRALHRAASTERAPAHLRERIELERSRTPSRSLSGFGLPALGSLGLRAWSGAVALVAAAVVAAVLLLGGGPTTGTPSVASAAALATKGAVAPAPGVDPTARYRLLAGVGDLHFPNWEAEHTGWNAVGSRTDRVGNRDVKTVFYRHGDQRIAYSIVSTPKIRSGGPTVFISRGRTVYAWTERGHTCLLSGSGVSPATMRNLIAITRNRLADNDEAEAVG